ncbi:hypothetical protein BGZ65_011399, partial [Modicella reniformis]
RRSSVTPERTPLRIETANTDDGEYIVTPIHRSTLRGGSDGWEDDDYPDSIDSKLTSPFISPSQWDLQGTLITSTPKLKRTPIRSTPGITTRQRVKDLIGKGSSESPLGSPSSKKNTRSNHLLSPEQKQQTLIDRLEDLMHENDPSQVMTVAEDALKEEVRLLRRSQRKAERMTMTSAFATGLQESVGEDFEVQEDMNFVTVGLDDDHDHDASNDNNILQTPVKKKPNSPSLLGPIMPSTPTGRTPRPISTVISAIGAASRRNVNAPVSPFVRTPSKKTVDLFRLEDFGLPSSPFIGEGMSDRQNLISPVQLFEGTNEHPSIPSSSMATAAVPDIQPLNHRHAVDTISQKKQPDQEDAPVSVSQPLAKERAESKPPKLHKNAVENERRTEHMKEAGITERQLKMTVEEFHRHCTEEQIRLFELQAEAWIQQFQEQSDRVRSALLEGE